MLTRRKMLALGMSAWMADDVLAQAYGVGSGGAPSNIDPFTLFDPPLNAGYTNLAGKVVSTPTLSGTTALGILYGQSNGGNHTDGTYSPVNPTKIHNLNPYNALFYRSLQPMLGCSGDAAHWMPETQDLLVSNSVFTDVIILPTSISGTTQTDWSNGWVAYRMVQAILRCRAVGIPVTFIYCQQGESGPFSTSLWKAAANGVRDTVQGMGVTAPIFLAKSTMFAGVVQPTVQTAVNELCSEQPTVFKQGGDTDSLTVAGGYRMSDGTHLSASGNHANAALAYNAINAVF